MADNLVDIWTLTAGAAWNEPALQGVFLQGLSDQLRDERALCDQPHDLNARVTLAVSLDNRLRQRGRERVSRTSTLPTFSVPSVIQHTQLSPAQCSLTSPPSAPPGKGQGNCGVLG